MKKSICLLMMAAAGLLFSQTAPVKVHLVSNGHKLNADMYPAPGSDLKPALILLHGYPGSERDMFNLGKNAGKNGVNVLIFNYQGTWSSEGSFSFESSMDNIGSAVRFMKDPANIKQFHIDTSNIVVCGHSYGGAMALNAALYNPEIRRIISIAGADESVFGRKMKTDPEFRKKFEQMLGETVSPVGPVRLDLLPFLDLWISNLDYYDLVKHSGNLAGRDILLIGGWDDHSILIEEHILPLYRSLKARKAEHIKIKVFESDHEFNQVSAELTETIIRWVKKKKIKNTN